MAAPALVGRDALIDEIVGWITRDRRAFALLRGPAGVGKTSLAAVVQERLDVEGVPTHRVRATESSRMVPFGALAPLLAGGPEPSSGWGHPAAVLTALIESVRGRFGDQLVLFVDDLPLLDAGSLTAVLQLGEHAGVQVVATARDEHGVPESFSSAASGATGRTWSVAPLDDAAIEEIAVGLLGSRLVPGSVERLCRAALGIPLVAIELVAEATRVGTVEPSPSDPGAVVLGDLPLSARLRDLVSVRIEHLDDAMRAATELVSAGRPLPISAVDPVVLERLEEAAVVDVADGTVELAHPLIGEAVRETTPTTRWARRMGEAAAIWAALPATPDTVLRTVVMRRAAGETVDEADLLIAAQRGLDLLDHRLVIELLTPLADDRHHEALVLRGTARSAIGDDAAAGDLRVAVDTAPDDAALARAAQRLALELGTRQNDAVAAAEAARKAFHLVDDEAPRQFLHAEVRKWELLSGEAVAGTAPSTDPAARLNECAVGAVVAAMSGQLDDADRLSAEGIPLARQLRDVLTYGEELLQLSRILAIGFRGDAQAMLRAVDEAREGSQVSGRGRDAEGLWAFLEASAHYSAGAFEAAETAAIAAIHGLVERDFIGLEPAARGVLAGTLARSGRSADAETEMAALPASARDDQRAALLVARAEAALAHADGRSAEAVDTLVVAARTAIAGGFGAMAAVTAHDAVRLGGASEVVDLLDEVATTADGEFFALLASHARGVAEADAAAIDVAARHFAELHLVGIAAEASDDLARVLRGARSPGAAEAERRAIMLRSMVPATDVVTLTQRELEVARAAAGRRRSREIAADLGLSVRTVDNHLRSVYRKLGIGGRDELDDALRDVGLSPDS
ncbi:LuxR C-terminal-related transcriptional regulator [Actinospongicola halichondriae]|uniref:LuxR C-terminal-related transcriptional regulator n=1 Tax=Actinospongicola halichondriae TaxID=3236844 RepID=UPI003D3E71F7